MKRLLFGLLALSVANFCNAQAADKKGEAKFPPPTLTKNKAVSKSANTAKFPPPILKNDDELKPPPPPALKKNKAPKKSEKVKFPPPVLKD
ncbi:hypothetical protein V9K67_26350 [Paraflavisolibacter sp. H34]|uniref:hypothetical protein n=1 Tax=Huijunlia imazamoxiresistens TaxID=3127457 RepID=UPI003018827F